MSGDDVVDDALDGALDGAVDGAVDDAAVDEALRRELEEELLRAVRVVRRSAPSTALAAALDWEERLWAEPLEAVAARHGAREEDARALVLPVTACRAAGLAPRQVAAFTDRRTSDRAVVACWAAGLDAAEIDALAAAGAPVEEAAVLTLAALRRPR